MGTHQPDGRKNSEASHRRHPPSFDNFFIMAGAARALNLAYRMAVPIAVGGALASSAIFDVKGGTRAVIFDRVSGVKEGVINEGTHFLIPWLQRSIIFDVRTKPRSISTTTGSKDLQMVSLTLRVLHRPNVQALPKIYQNLGADYDERVLPSIGNEVLKAIVAQFDAAELITQREAVSQRIRNDLTRRAAEFNIALEDVSITHMTFGREFTKAVEQSADTISKAVSKSGDGLIQIRKIEASREIAQTLASNPNVAYLPGGSNKQGGQYLLSVGRA